MHLLVAVEATAPMMRLQVGVRIVINAGSTDFSKVFKLQWAASIQFLQVHAPLGIGDQLGRNLLGDALETGVRPSGAVNIDNERLQVA